MDPIIEARQERHEKIEQQKKMIEKAKNESRDNLTDIQEAKYNEIRQQKTC